ncbi:hypothetical protein GGS20DRAFT_116104 [Poronia punctata]|nr:hypothetical protein GGS20DRAFT_116104 [Poronia punctata]
MSICATRYPHHIGLSLSPTLKNHTNLTQEQIMHQARETAPMDIWGIGEGLLVRRRGSLSSNGSSIDLGEERQELLRRDTQMYNLNHSNALVQMPLENAAFEARPPMPLGVIERGSQLETCPLEPPLHIPLYRYYCDVQRHEEISLGLATDHRVKKQRHALCSSQAAAARLVVNTYSGLTSSPALATSGSGSSLTSSSGVESETSSIDALDGLQQLYASPEWQSLSQDEQARCLHMTQKLKRRIRDEENPRGRKSPRVRKRARGDGLPDGGAEGQK